MKNLHILPTDKPSMLYSKDGNHKLANSTMAMDWYISSAGYKPTNIYITDDSKIKDGDWVLLDYPKGFEIKKTIIGIPFQNAKCINSEIQYDNCNHKKIILTTDLDLQKDGVQAIDDEFLEWFCSKNVEIDFVEVIAIEDEKN